MTYRGQDLSDFTEGFLTGIEKERFIMKDLDSYVNAPNDRRVCCLYGLRRTGKTVMMMQEIRKLNQYDNCIFMRCEDGDTMWQIRQTIENNKDCKYIFIDEATKASNFISTSSVLADAYAGGGKKVVLAGTDSLGFLIAKYDELYDRANFIHTTYIPFKEYRELLGGSLMDYIEYGGTLSPENTFYNNDMLNEYSNSAIVYNIVHSLEKWNQGRNYGALQEVVDCGELPSFINKVLEYHNRTFLASIIEKDFKSHDLGSLADLMAKSGIADPSHIKTDEMTERIRFALGIRKELLSLSESHKVNEEAVDMIIEYLKKLDVLYEIPQDKQAKTKEYIFTQTGMRYSQASDFADILIKSEDIFGNYTDAEQKAILAKLKSDICGGILEDIIYYQSVRNLSDNADCRIEKYRKNTTGQEIDVLIEDFEKCSTVAIEVKLSDKYAENQMNHLLNDEFCSEIESKTGIPIINKLVVYLGATNYISEKNVIYLNAEDYLSHTKEIMSFLSDYPIENKENLQEICHEIGIKISEQLKKKQDNDYPDFE